MNVLNVRETVLSLSTSLVWLGQKCPVFGHFLYFIQLKMPLVNHRACPNRVNYSIFTSPGDLHALHSFTPALLELIVSAEQEHRCEFSRYHFNFQVVRLLIKIQWLVWVQQLRGVLMLYSYMFIIIILFFSVGLKYHYLHCYLCNLLFKNCLKNSQKLFL